MKTKLRRAFTVLTALLCLAAPMTRAETGYADWDEPALEPIRVEMAVQYYDEDTGTVLEIPRLTGVDNAEVSAINAELETVYAQYAHYLDGAGDPAWCEVYCYPTTGATYVNILLAACEYPTYGTDGELYGYVYDREQERRISALEALELIGKGESRLREEFAAWLAGDAGESGTLISWELSAFRIREDGSIVLYMEADVAIPGADSWKGFYSWEDGSFARVNAAVLVPSHEVDAMDPPIRANLGGM